MHILEAIISDAKVNKWSYPRKFEAFKNAGVKSYTVHFIDNFDSVYEGDFGIWNESAPTDYRSSVLSETFSIDGIKQAMKDNAQVKQLSQDF